MPETAAEVTADWLESDVETPVSDVATDATAPVRPPIWLATTDDAEEAEKIMLLSDVETVDDWVLSTVDVLRLRLESDVEIPANDELAVEIADAVVDDCRMSVEEIPETDELVVEIAEELAEPCAVSDETADDVTADWLLNADDTPFVERTILETEADTDSAVRLETKTERLPTTDDTELNDRDTADVCVDTVAIELASDDT